MDRLTAPTSRLASLQVLRFVAALGVVWEHAATRANPHNLTGGAAGVDLFFVLSGFVISGAAQARPETFLKDRLARIFPIYWVWALAWLALALGHEPFNAWRLFTTFTLLPSPTSAPIDSYVGVGWTLSFEILFYAVVLLVLRGLSWRVALAAYGALALAALFASSAPLHFFGSPMAAEFLLGVLAFHLGRGRPVAGGLALVVAVATFPFVPRHLSLPMAALQPMLGLGRVAILGPLAFLAVWGSAQFQCRSRVWRPLALLGDASYSIYLSHLALMDVAGRVLGHPLAPVVAALLALGVGLAAHLTLEKPLLGAARHALGLSRRDQADPAGVRLAHGAQDLDAHPGDPALRRA